MKKIYVLDTNVLLSDADAIFKFEDNHVIIPITCLEELDKFKKEQTEVGRNARSVSRKLDEVREKGKLVEGIQVNDKGGILQVVLFDDHIASMLPFTDMGVMDNRILATTLYLKDKFENVILVTKDVNLRIKADVLEVQAEDYKNNKIDTDELFSGHERIYVPEQIINKIYAQGKIDISDIEATFAPKYPNMCITLHNEFNEKNSALCIYNDVMKELQLISDDLTTMNITPRNGEQQFALSLLLDPNIKLVTIAGKAGSGKGITSAAAALKQIIEDKVYEKLVIGRPIIALNNAHQLGFMPGDLSEKLNPWLKPFEENICFILNNYVKTSGKVIKPPKNKKKKDLKAYDDEMEKEVGKLSFFDELKAWDFIELASLETIKGRTFHNQIVIITEAQDCTLADIKAIITRMGEGSKLILEGDWHQCDHPYLDSYNNGLAIVAEKFKEYPIASHITLKKSERSALAELAADIL